MGDVVHMILDGELCQECGESMFDDLDFPHSCPACENTHQIKRKVIKHETATARPDTPHLKP